ncbi:D-amino-acid transaminase [Cohnella fermenti]|uniref:D-alanine aminotransferase n=1 Tax=Cohnella fermenti TaxID=2565925 RepID=A0A4S4BH60_9BACL|nr:D-amino-acid transaminase [Cohnella fermenti]THF73859.1 D-amino-acid transaminase [Cohnella fermenti]
MGDIYLFDGRFLPKEEVNISPEDRGYYYGDGIYDVFRVYGGRLFEPELHFRRLERTAAGLRLQMPIESGPLQTKLEELIARNRLTEGTLYVQITRGTSPRSLPLPQGVAPVLVAYTTEFPRPVAAMEAGIRAKTVEDIRWLHCDYKTLNLLPNVLAKQEALDAGADDAILHRSGLVTECCASNIMIVQNGSLVTHPANNLILHGVTRAVILRLAQAAGIPAEERPFSLEELHEAEEAFITGTTVEVTPIVAVDGRPIGGGSAGPVTRRLQQLFANLIGQ